MVRSTKIKDFNIFYRLTSWHKLNQDFTFSLWLHVSESYETSYFVKKAAAQG
jgi:hypothetical protein